jgi:hypothetical protein
MQQSGLSTDLAGSETLTADLRKILGVVANWAADRPVLADVVLFGSRLRPERPRFTPIELAVRYDERGMTDGFDDWIEQLRSDFSDLRAALSEPVRVLTPDHGPSWRSIIEGTTIPEIGMGKVRVLRAPALQLTSHPAIGAPGTLWATARRWSAQFLNPIAAPGSV